MEVGAKSPPLPKISQTNPTMMKLGTIIPYLKKIQNIYESRETSPRFCWHQYFSREISKFFLYQEINVYIAFWYRISNYFKFSWVFKDLFNKPGYNFDDVRSC